MQPSCIPPASLILEKVKYYIKEKTKTTTTQQAATQIIVALKTISDLFIPYLVFQFRINLRKQEKKNKTQAHLNTYGIIQHTKRRKKLVARQTNSFILD